MYMYMYIKNAHLKSPRLTESFPLSPQEAATDLVVVSNNDHERLLGNLGPPTVAHT